MGELKSEEGDRKQKKKKKLTKKEKHWWTPGSERREEEVERVRRGAEKWVWGEMLPQTDSDTKLLYCWMLRLRMSEQGPRTRSKRGRSSLTHFRGPRATTVAARGRFISRAISPGGKKKTSVTDLKFKIHENILQCHTQRHVYRNSVGHSHKDLFFHHF